MTTNRIPFDWDKYQQDKSKAVYRCGERPKKVEKYFNGYLYSERQNGLSWLHDDDGKVSRFVYTEDPYDLFLEI